MEQIDRVLNLSRWHVDVQDAEVLRQSVTDEHTAALHEPQEFEIDCLQLHQCVCCRVGTQISIAQTGIPSQIIVDRIASVNVVVDEHAPVLAKYRYTRERQMHWSH